MKLFVNLAMVVFLSSSLFALKIEDAQKDFIREVPKQGVVISYYDSIKDAKKAVVNISTHKTVQQADLRQMPFFNDPLFREFFKGFGDVIPQDRVERALGSGVVVSSDGYIITNSHVVDGADEITVTLAGDSTTEHKAKLIGTDPKSDVAIIKVDLKNLSFIKFADSNAVREGDVVFAIGNPFGVGGTVTSGIVSALNKSGVGINAYENYIQTDASINPGNSGGALVDSRGALVGINTAIISRSGGNVGIGFAIPSNMVKTISQALISDGVVKRGYLGVSIGDITADLKEFYLNKSGALVMDIQKDSPAQKAGLKRGDLIIEIDSKPVTDASDLRNKIGMMLPNTNISIRFIRDKKTLITNTTLTTLDDEKVAISNGDMKLFNGLKVKEADGSVVVVEVEPNSKAAKKGFVVNDMVIQIENMPIASLKDLNKALETYKGKKRVYIQRDNRTFLVVCD
ncbi:MAG: Do family serine endopeptidase [Arcobacteraceae bacterium]|nr:Do family serine endopeptidase [Arcobacteraceae bacterium]